MKHELKIKLTFLGAAIIFFALSFNLYQEFERQKVIAYKSSVAYTIKQTNEFFKKAEAKLELAKVGNIPGEVQAALEEYSQTYSKTKTIVE